MKKIVLAISMLLLLSGHWQLKAQKEEKIWDSIPRTFIGVGTGINSQTGMIGFMASVAATKNILCHVSIGTGGWGNKISLFGEYQINVKRGWGIGFGYSFFPGDIEVKQNLEVKTGSFSTQKQDVTLVYGQTSTISLFASHHWLIRNRSRLALDFGLSIGMEKDPYKVKDANVILSEDSKELVGMLTPGGIIFGIHYSFGLK